jgi:hypothetical protein
LLACEQAVTSIGALFGQLRRVRHFSGVDQLYELYANGRAGRMNTRARRMSNEPGRPIPID